MQPRTADVRRVPTTGLTTDERTEIRALLDGAFGEDDEERFTDDDWEHALGGVHFILVRDGRIVTHASVVERTLAIDGRSVQTGYVEAVATATGHEGQGFGSLVIEDVDRYIDDRYELGALGTGRHAFYGRLGWRTWQGRSAVREPGGDRPTPDDDGYIMVLRTRRSPAFELTGTISCDVRPGDVW